MITQEVALDYLLILAIEILNADFSAEGSYYKGDLLNAVLSIKKENWLRNEAHWQSINKLISENLEKIKQLKPKINLENFYASRFIIN
jgi:hypothetical protein